MDLGKLGQMLSGAFSGAVIGILIGLCILAYAYSSPERSIMVNESAFWVFSKILVAPFIFAANHPFIALSLVLGYIIIVPLLRSRED